MPVRLGRDPLRYHHSPANSKTASTLKQGSKMSMEEAKKNRKAPPDTPSNLGSNASKDIEATLTALLADVFALHVPPKNCHCHISAQYFWDYHPPLDDQSHTIHENRQASCKER